MKAAFFSLGLIASFASFAVASPAADAETQLEGRDPVICIGCINDSCTAKPSGCETLEPVDGSNVRDCDEWCAIVKEGNCECCDVVDGFIDEINKLYASCEGCLAYCYPEPKPLVPRDEYDKDNFGSKQVQEFQKLVNKSVEGPICPAGYLNPPLQSMLKDGLVE